MDGQFALDHLTRIKPDVVLMDVDMPRLDGLAALERIVAEYTARGDVQCPNDAWRTGNDQALARGAVDFIEADTRGIDFGRSVNQYRRQSARSDECQSALPCSPRTRETST